MRNVDAAHTSIALRSSGALPHASEQLHLPGVSPPIFRAMRPHACYEVSPRRTLRARSLL